MNGTITQVGCFKYKLGQSCSQARLVIPCLHTKSFLDLLVTSDIPITPPSPFVFCFAILPLFLLFFSTILHHVFQFSAFLQLYCVRLTDTSFRRLIQTSKHLSTVNTCNCAHYNYKQQQIIMQQQLSAGIFELFFRQELFLKNTWKFFFSSFGCRRIYFHC